MRTLVSPRSWPIWEICPQTQKGTVIFRTERSLRCLSLLPTFPLRAKPAHCHRRGNGALWVDLGSLTDSLDPIYNTPPPVKHYLRPVPGLDLIASKGYISTRIGHRCCSQIGLSGGLHDAQATADLLRELVWNLRVPRNCFDSACSRAAP